MESHKDLQARISRFRKLHEQAPAARYFAPLADLLRQDGRYDEALGLLEEGLAFHPDYTAGLVIRGRTLLAVGRQADALEVWNRVLVLDAENVLALEALALWALDNREWESAVPPLEQLGRLMEEDRSWAGLLLEAQGHLALSAEIDPESADGDPDQGTSIDTMTLVDIYLGQGYRDRALEVLRRMLPGSKEDRAEILDRIQLLEENGDDGKEVVEQGNADGKNEGIPAEAARTEVNSAGRPLISEAERVAREEERSQRRDNERRQFEEWLEKIRFNGSNGT